MWGIERLLLRILAALAVVVGMAQFAPALAAEAVVTDIRIGAQKDLTRIVLEIDRQVAFSVFTLTNPNRIVVDLPEMGWRLPARPLPGATGVFKKLRYGLFKPGNSRLVLDVRTPAAIDSAFILEPGQNSGKNSGYRLVLDLASTTLKAFKEGAGKTPLRVAAVRPSPKVTPPPARQKTKMVFVQGASPAVKLTRPPAPSSESPPAPVNVSVQSQASPFRLAPRKPEPRHQGKKNIIFIDAGHGGVDPGTIGPSGIYEKHITLAMARELKRQLEQTGRFKVLMTRSRDVFVRLRERVRLARVRKADLFISVHADTVRNRKINGPAVYTLSEKSSDNEARELAEKENKADLIAGVDLTHETPEVTNILIDLAQRESMNQSARFATSLIRELKRKTHVLRNTHRFAGFAVLKAPDIPSVLLEMGFLSNPQDERRLRSASYRAKLASAVTKAVASYFVRIEEANRN
ncbi:MAG: N-acetylmuramoyl-L-alanine amidase [Alphaproteobacteria bacterium]|jgi:N-acetylmuramoyl-L-alanine amidase|nr:N-acetylmuramoyl-L-alanine amidase [Alphaproteobacteria bacterium]